MILRSGKYTKGQSLIALWRVWDSISGFMTFNWAHVITAISTFLCAVSYWLQIGTTSVVGYKLRVDNESLVNLQTFTTVAQLVLCPLVGIFGDICGSKAAMLLVYSTSAASYGLLAVTSSVTLFYFTRLLLVFSHALQVGQMIVIRGSGRKWRSVELGKIMAAYGLGMMAAPHIKRSLVQWQFGKRDLSLFACGGTTIGMLLCLLCLPSRKTQLNQASKTPLSNIFNLASILKNPTFIMLVLVKICTEIPIGMLQNVLAALTADRFQLIAVNNTNIKLGINILSIVVYVIGVRLLAKKFSDLQIIKGSTGLLIVVYAVLGVVSSSWQLCAVLCIMTVALTLLTITITSSMTKTVDISNTGAILGLNMSITSIIRLLIPKLSGSFIDNNVDTFAVFGFLASVTAFMLLVIRMQR